MRFFWLGIDYLAPFLVVLALLAPFIGLAAGAIAGHNLIDGGKRGRRALGGFVSGIVAAPLFLFLSMCGVPPGEGLDAREGRQRAVIVIKALDSYRLQFGSYPDSLHRLVPRFLSQNDLATPFGHSDSFEYRLEQADFVLTFDYVGPGMNTCDYSSRTTRWDCSGYF
jgi:hypothetical protein